MYSRQREGEKQELNKASCGKERRDNKARTRCSSGRRASSANCWTSVPLSRHLICILLLSLCPPPAFSTFACSLSLFSAVAFFSLCPPPPSLSPSPYPSPSLCLQLLSSASSEAALTEKQRYTTPGSRTAWIDMVSITYSPPTSAPHTAGTIESHPSQDASCRFDSSRMQKSNSSATLPSDTTYAGQAPPPDFRAGTTAPNFDQNSESTGKGGAGKLCYSTILSIFKTIRLYYYCEGLMKYGHPFVASLSLH